MYPSLGRVGYPVAKIRLFMSIITAGFIGFLLYSASVNLKWFTIIRGFYLLLGIAEGVLIGELEARIVIRKLIRDTETMAWQILPISIVSFGLPLLLAITVFGVSEFLPFVAYLVLPIFPVYYATTSWHYNEFEKENKVQIFMFVIGLKYWREPIPDASKNINNTLLYTQLISFEGEEYHVKVAKTLEEVKELLTAGFEYIKDHYGISVFRKRK